MALFITLLVGLFTLVGSLIIFFTKNNKKIIDFSISVGFGVLFALILLELIPETIELIQTKYSVVTTIFIVIALSALGIILLKILDKFIPHHDAHNKDNLSHIGIMTSVALIIHNLLEGMAIYTSLNSSIKFGMLLGIGVALHNIPLGMSITSLFYKNKKTKNKAILVSLLVSLSTFVGGLMTLIFAGGVLDEFSKGIILCITLGMLIYIVVFELFPHMQESKNKKNTILGTVIGIVLLVLSTLFE